MKHPRITIAELALVVLIVAIGLAAIRGGSPAWAGAMLSITFFALICSLLGIAMGRDPRRAFWLGFAVLGWSYLLLLHVPWPHEKVGRFLLAPNLFAYLEEVLHAEPEKAGGLQSLPGGMLGAAATGQGSGGNVSGGAEDFTDFVRIGMAMEALLWAFLGGWAARYFASGRDGASATEGAAPADTPHPGG